MKIPMINGRLFDWSSISVVLPNGPTPTITEINYKDEDGSEPVYGKGRTPRGYGKGNYKSEGSFTIGIDEQVEFELAVMALSGGKKLYDHKPFPILVAFANDGDSKVVTHILNDVKIKARDFGLKQGDKANNVKYDFFCLGPINTEGTDAVGPGLIP